jgi:glycosyltransferase involved in cell wall biosynthesis
VITNSTPKSDAVHLYVWSGDAKRARDLVIDHYSNIEIRVFPHRRLREATILERVRLLRSFRGGAIVFYFQSLADLKYGQILGCIHFLHRCHETVLCDSSGRWESLQSVQILRSVPRVSFSILLDVKTLVSWWFYLRFLLMRSRPVCTRRDTGDPEVAYLIPAPGSMGSSGGAISHIRGVLSGLKAAATTCRVFTGTPLEQDAFENEIVAAGQRTYFFWEATLLAYNFAFARRVQQHLATAAPRYLYQRHCSFSIAGALLSRRLKVPLILEYNGPQGWIADHWDPTLFRNLVTLSEEVTLRCASRIIVVSDALKAELMQRGIEAERIRVNPNGVDPDYFYPGCGRDAGRKRLAVGPDDVLVGFVGSFSLWHGIEVLQQAIVRLLNEPAPCRLRFVLIGDGLLHGEMRSALAAYEELRTVIFTGPLPRNEVAALLDASDILVSPHTPTPDGSRFFGSPTKLFEYMAMGKGIVASRLEQLAEVLVHDQTALLVTPGSVEELAEAIRRLATDPNKRESLGAAARQAAVERHSWARNVAWAFSDVSEKAENPRPKGEDFHDHTNDSTLLPLLPIPGPRNDSRPRVWLPSGKTSRGLPKLPNSTGNSG